MKQSFFLLLLLGFAFSINAQQDTSRTNVSLGLTGSYQSGNFQRVQFINSLDISLNSQNQQWNFLTRHLYLYQTVFGNPTQNDYLGRNFLTYRLNDKADVFGAVFIERYFIKKIDWHTQFGVGTRYKLVHTPRVFLQIGLMGSYSDKQYNGVDFENFDNENSNTITAFFITPVLNTQLVIIPKRLIIKGLGWFQQSVVESQNWRYVIEGQVLMPLRKDLNIKVSVNNFYENINLTGVKANDLFITYGISYQFKK